MTSDIKALLVGAVLGAVAGWLMGSAKGGALRMAAKP